MLTISTLGQLTVVEKDICRRATCRDGSTVQPSSTVVEANSNTYPNASEEMKQENAEGQLRHAHPSELIPR